MEQLLSLAPPVTDERTEQIIDALDRDADAFVSLFCDSVKGQVVVEAVERAVIRHALRKMQTTPPASNRAQKNSLTRLSMYTGMKTHVIRDKLENSTRVCEDNISNEAAILGAWAREPTLRDPETGEPKQLLIIGANSNGTFQGLVQRWAGRGISYRYVLEQLLANGNVEVVKEHWVRLVNPNWVFFPNREDVFLGYAVNAIIGLTKTVRHNLKTIDRPDKKWVQRFAYSHLIAKKWRPEAEQALNCHLIRCWEEARLILRQYEAKEGDETIDIGEILGVGFYYWRDYVRNSKLGHPDAEITGPWLGGDMPST